MAIADSKPPIIGELSAAEESYSSLSRGSGAGANVVVVLELSFLMVMVVSFLKNLKKSDKFQKLKGKNVNFAHRYLTFILLNF